MPAPTPPRDPAGTRMFAEAASAGVVVRAQLERNAPLLATLGAQWHAVPPRVVVTCARGSSDHAATYAKYLVETRAHVLTASAAPSVQSLYLARQVLRNSLFLAISQSGRSPDLLAATRHARAGGATVLALVNDEHSPLAALAHHVLPLCAGTEHSVAATKTYLASLAAIAHLVSAWTGDHALAAALQRLPDALERAWELDWRAALPVLRDARNLFVVGRGLGLGVAQEAALKCKETCALHAEAFSSAEVLHGPQALLGPGFPALLFAQADEAREGIAELGASLVARGVPVLAAGVAVEGAIALPTLEEHPALQPLLLAQSFYRMANALSVARGHDPDAPPHLQKVTRTQ